MLENVRADLTRARLTWKVGSGLPFLRALVGAYGLHALLVYRLGRWLDSLWRQPAGLPIALVLFLPYRLLAAYVTHAYGVRLELSAAIGPGLYVGHFSGIRLADCQVGAGCAINHRVTIVGCPGEGNGPIIGNAVWIGPHVEIRGRTQVGDGSTVAAGSRVLEDVSERCLVMGNPARVVH